MYHKWAVKNGFSFAQNVTLREAKFDTFGGLYCTYILGQLNFLYTI